MVDSLSEIGEFKQVSVRLPKSDVLTIKNSEYDINTYIRNQVHLLANSIRGGSPVMEKKLPKSEPTMTLKELVYETARLYLSEGDKMDRYIMQGRMFTQSQCESIYERIKETGMMTTSEAVEQILGKFEL